jgi:bifunctional non-homologous end joining protein LigD
MLLPIVADTTPGARMGNDSTTATLAGINLSHPDRVLYPGQGITKRDLAEYYGQVADWILPHLVSRPLTLIRCPAGHEKECFVQRRASGSIPRSVRRVEIADEDSTATYVVADSLPALISLVQIGVLELHTWGARRDRLDRPDRMIFDLDPDPSLPWQDVTEAALDVRDRLTELGLQSFVKTTGGKGLHVVVPLVRRHGWDQVRDFSRAVADTLIAAAPDRYIAQSSIKERAGKIFIDYLRNGWSASAVAAYSTRARPGAPVSVPLAWKELGPDVRSDTFTIDRVVQRLHTMHHDPWAGYTQVRQQITRSMLRELRI